VRHSTATGIVIFALALAGGCARDHDAKPAREAALNPPPAAEVVATAPPPAAKSTPAPAPKPAPAQAAKPASAPTAPQTTKPKPPAVQPAPPLAAPKPPALDLAALERRLRSTDAIGALTKITLKNQVDDLLDRFRTFYQGKLETDLTTLRRSYDLLLLKIVALLQDDDKPLANAIVASREEIWGILSDRAKFASL
jgi:hypothetical protein